MPQHFIDFRDATVTLDYLREQMDFLSATEQKPFAEIVTKLMSKKNFAEEKLLEIAKNFSEILWPIRRALNQWRKTQEGADAEWSAVIASARPTTAILLKRLRKIPSVKTLDDALATSDASMAIHDQEEMELAFLRPEILLELWQSHKEELAPLVKQAKKELAALQERLARLHQLALQSRASQQETLLQKLTQLEEKIFLHYESPLLESLDAELFLDVSDIVFPPQ